MEDDMLKENVIDGLLIVIQDPALTLEERHIINNCVSLLINKRSAGQVALLERAIFCDDLH